MGLLDYAPPEGKRKEPTVFDMWRQKHGVVPQQAAPVPASAPMPAMPQVAQVAHRNPAPAINENMIVELDGKAHNVPLDTSVLDQDDQDYLRVGGQITPNMRGKIAQAYINKAQGVNPEPAAIASAQNQIQLPNQTQVNAPPAPTPTVFDRWRDKQAAESAQRAESNVAEMGDVSRGVKRGYESLKGTLYGAAGLVGSAAEKTLGVGKALQDWGYEGYKEKMQEASEYPATYDWKDITKGDSWVDNTGRAIDWAQGTAGELIPSMVEALASSAIGAVGGTMAAPGPGTAAGALAGFVGKRAVKKMVDETMKQAMSKGFARQAAKELAEKHVERIGMSAIQKSAMRNFGAKVGMVAGVAPMEAGGNWGENMEQGINNPWSALATGTAAAFLELAGGNSKIVDKILGPKAGKLFKEAIDTAEQSTSKRLTTSAIKTVADIGKAVAEQAPEEFLQEAGQEFLSMVNVAVNDPHFEMFSQESTDRLIGAGLAGAVGGGLGGVVSYASDRLTKPTGGVKDTLDKWDASRKVDPLGDDEIAKDVIDKINSGQELDEIAGPEAEEEASGIEAEGLRPPLTPGFQGPVQVDPRSGGWVYQEEPGEIPQGEVMPSNEAIIPPIEPGPAEQSAQAFERKFADEERVRQSREGADLLARQLLKEQEGIVTPHEEILRAAIEDVKAGEKGTRVRIEAPEYGPGQAEYKGQSSTYPEWMKDNGWAKKDVLEALDRSLNDGTIGQSRRYLPITEKQQAIVDAANEYYQNQVARAKANEEYQSYLKELENDAEIQRGEIEEAERAGRESGKAAFIAATQEKISQEAGPQAVDEDDFNWETGEWEKPEGVAVALGPEQATPPSAPEAQAQKGETETSGAKWVRDNIDTFDVSRTDGKDAEKLPGIKVIRTQRMAEKATSKLKDLEASGKRFIMSHGRKHGVTRAAKFWEEVREEARKINEELYTATQTAEGKAQPTPKQSPPVAPEPQAASEPGGVKEPWEMTKAQWFNHLDGLALNDESGDLINPFTNRPYKATAKPAAQLPLAKQEHRDSIKKALADGLPVPPEVLADYPELQGKEKPGTLNKAEGKKKEAVEAIKKAKPLFEKRLGTNEILEDVRTANKEALRQQNLAKREAVQAAREKKKAEAVKAPTPQELQAKANKENSERMARNAANAPNFRAWIRAKGGLTTPTLKDHGLLDDKAYIGIRNKNGMGIDEMLHMAVNDGWMQKGATEEDFVDAIVKNIKKTSDSEKDLLKAHEDDYNKYIEQLRQEAEDAGLQDRDIEEAERSGEEEGIRQADEDFKASSDADEAALISIFGKDWDKPQSNTLVLTSEEGTAWDKGEVKDLGPQGKKAVFPTEKIKPAEYKNQGDLFGPKKGETLGLFDDAETKLNLSSITLNNQTFRDNRQAIGQFRKWMRTAGIPKPLLNALDVEVKDAIKIIGNVRKSEAEHGQKLSDLRKAIGSTTFFDDASVLVQFASDMSLIKAEDTAYHEAFHVMLNKLVSEENRTALLDHYKGNEEDAAKAFSKFVTNQETTSIPKPIRKIFYQIKRILTRIGNAFTQSQYKTPEDFFRAIYFGADLKGAQTGKPGTKLQVEAWHGSPHEWAGGKADLSKVGTGEGAQAFGWGMYFTDLEGIAKHYASSLGGASRIPKDIRAEVSKNIEAKIFENGMTEWSEQDWSDYSFDLTDFEKTGDVSNIEWILDAAGITLSDVGVKSARNLYKVTLHKGKKVGEYTWLDYDKGAPDDIKQKIKTQLEKEMPQIGIDTVVPPERKLNYLEYANTYKKMGYSLEDIKSRWEAYKTLPESEAGITVDGERVYTRLKNLLEGKAEYNGTSPKQEASLFLLRAGIDGIRYPAGSLSGIKDTGAQNYVVFDENAVTVEAHTKFSLDQSLSLDDIFASALEFKEGKRVVPTVGYRYGDAPQSGKSYNTRENKYEKGISLASAAGFPESRSFATMGAKANRKKYYFAGDVVDYGGDDEFVMNNYRRISAKEYHEGLKNLDPALILKAAEVDTAKNLKYLGYTGYNEKYETRKKELNTLYNKRYKTKGHLRPPDEGGQQTTAPEAAEKTTENLKLLGQLVEQSFKEAGFSDEVLKRVKVEFKEVIEFAQSDIEASAKDWRKLGRKATAAAGATTIEKYRAVVEIALTQSPEEIRKTAWHEAFHIVAQWILPTHQYNKLMYHYDNNEEAAAEAFAGFMFNLKEYQAPVVGVRVIFRKLKRILERIKNGLLVRGFSRPEDFFEKIVGGQYQGDLSPRFATPGGTAPTRLEASSSPRIVYIGEQEIGDGRTLGLYNVFGVENLRYGTTVTENTLKKMGLLPAEKGAATKLRLIESAKEFHADMQTFTGDAIGFIKGLTETRKILATNKTQRKADTTAFERYVATPFHYFRKVGAAWRMFEDGQKRSDNYYEQVDNLTKAEDGQYWTIKLSTAKKQIPEEYKKLQSYFKHRDQNAIGYKVKKDKKEFILVDPRGNEAGKFATEDQAWEVAIQSDLADLKKKGYSEQAVDAAEGVFRMRHKGFNLLAKNMREVIAKFEELGIDLPTYSVWEKGEKIEVDLKLELARMGDMRGYYMPRSWKPGSIVLYATKPGQHPRIETFDFEISAANRQRTLQAEGYSVTSKKTGQMPEDVFEMAGQTVAVNAMLNEALSRLKKKEPALADFGLEGKIVAGAGKNKDFILLGSTSKQQNKAMKAMGGKWYKGTTDNIERWHFVNKTASFEKRLAKALAVAEVSGAVDQQTAMLFAGNLAEQVGNIIKERGSRKHMVKRSDVKGLDVWEGYEEDIDTAMAQYVRGLAAGEAKHIMAVNMVRHMTGTDISWDEYKAMLEDEGEEAPEYTDYLDFVKARGIDPVQQPNIFKDATAYMKDMLRNQEMADRVIGMVKGLAVLKYLGLKLSALPINLSAMATTVPAAMKGYADIGIGKAFSHIAKVSKLYVQYRRYQKTGNKTLPQKYIDLFDEIEKKGWGKAQFNREALSTLEGKVGRNWSRLIEIAMAPFAITENFNRMVTIASAYEGARANGKAHDEALEIGKDVSDHAHAVYSKVNYPHLLRGENLAAQALKCGYVFQQFSHNYLQTMFDLGYNKKDAKATMWMAASPIFLGGLGAFAGTALIKAALQALGADDPEEWFYSHVEENLGERAGIVARVGAPGLFGVSFKGSLALDLTKPPTTLAELLGAPGSVIGDLYEGGRQLLKGNTLKGVEKILPTSLASPVKAYRESTEGVTTRSNLPVFYGDKPLAASTGEAVIRFLGFNPARIASAREKQWNEQLISQKYTERRAAIYSNFHKFFLSPPEDRTKDRYIELLNDVREYNAALVKSGLIKKGYAPITDKLLRTNIKRGFRPSKRERLREEQ